MKIKKLTIKNINSLYGTFVIDFESPDFADGIFAITGPTGSGKTTILDAICLALFGKTPRLDGGSRWETLSKGAKKGLAALVFEVDGKEYLAQCAMTPSAATHELACGEKTLSKGLSDTHRLVASIIGMECEQFCRAVLLAQGKFDAFLSAKDDEKANILEQITDTGRYARIASKINEVSKNFETQINQAAAVVNSRQLLDPEVEKQMQTELAELTARNNSLQGEITVLEKLLTRFERIGFLLRALDDNTESTTRLEEEKKAFAADRVRLEAGEKAAKLQPGHDAFSKCRKEVESNQKRRQELLEKLPLLEKEN